MSITKMNNQYFQLVNQSAPRLLSLLDRNPMSPTYGSFDRDFWHYRIVKDFSSSIYQQGVLALAGLYSIDFPGNQYYRNDRIRELLIAGMGFWSGLQNSDGSFSEWFPYERSIVATAFTSYAMSQTLILLNKEINQDKKNIILQSLKRAGRWLYSQRELFVANHIAGAIAALGNIYLLTNDSFFRQSIQRKKKELAGFQDEEGWFSEYGGCDIGYLSVTVDYLAKYYSASGDKEALEMADRALNFMKFFIHPDGSAGGEYSTRNTAYIMRHGLEILKAELDTAREILTALKFHKLPGPADVDDRYFIFFFLPNLIQSLGEDVDTIERSQKQERFSKFFKNSGFLSVKNDRYHLIVGGKKGGALKLFKISDKPELIISDVGYFIQDTKKRIYTNQWLNKTASVVFNEGLAVKDLVIETQFCRAMFTQSSAFKLLLSRIYMIFFGHSSIMVRAFDFFLKKFIIDRHIKVPIMIRREIKIKEEGIILADYFYGHSCSKIIKIISASSLADGQSPTSRYYNSNDISKEDKELPDLVKTLQKEKRGIFSREISI